MFQNACLNEMIAFIAVAEEGSFTQAAETLRSTKSSTGKAIQKLERHLDIKLLNRTTRSVTLTEEGQIFYEVAKKAIDSINNTKELLDSRKEDAVGKIRVNLPVGIGRYVIQGLPNFVKKYPNVKIELYLSDKFEEVIEGKWDIVVRIGHLDDLSLIAKHLCTLKRILCASPIYLNQKGVPKDLDDLNSHDAVMYLSPGGKIRQWFFANENGVMEKCMEPIALFHDGRSFIDAIATGIGIGQIYDKAAKDLLENNSLIEVLPQYAIMELPVHAIIPSGRLMPKKTKVFLEFLETTLGEKRFPD